MAVSYVEITPSPIENATVRQSIYNGELSAFYINANEGYVLHDSALDTPEFDETSFEETGNTVLGYSEGTRSCGINYDWEENPREFYAITAKERGV